MLPSVRSLTVAVQLMNRHASACEQARKPSRTVAEPSLELYFRAPRRGCFNFDCRRFAAFRFGLLMIKVPLPMYSAL
jgi:hypothetical protein